MAERLSGRTLLVIGAFCVAGAWAWQAVAGSQTAQSRAAQAHVAVVDVERVLNQLEEIKAFNERLRAEVAVKQAELDKFVDRADEIVVTLNDLPPNAVEERERLQRDLREARAQGLVRQKLLEEELDISRGRAVRAAYQKMLGAVEQIAQREQFELVFFDDRAIPMPDGLGQADINSRIQSRRVLYSLQDIDITQRVLDWMNNQYRVGGGG